jgi:hypothetical protein
METQQIPGPEQRKADQRQPEGNPGFRKRSLIRRVMRPAGWFAVGLADWFGRKTVVTGAGLIGDAWNGVRQTPQRDKRFKVDESGGFDLPATAFSFGMSVEALERRLEQRRRVTCMFSYGGLFIAVLSLIFWIHSALNQPYTLARAMMVWEFLPFVGLSLLFAFHSALLNFQIRVRRCSNWRQFLSTEKEAFFPRW